MRKEIFLDVIAAMGLGIVFIAVLGLLIGMTTNARGTDDNLIVLSKDNTINLNYVIDGSMAKLVQSQLLEQDHRLKGGKPIFLYLNSPGGSISDGNSIIETAKGLNRPVHTISSFSASMSFIISQMLGTRYVMSTSTLMSHHASVSGLSGDLNGSLNTRFLALLADIDKVDFEVAKRSSHTVQEYKDMITHEMWINGPNAVTARFADKVVNVTCDKSLEGLGEPQVMEVFGFSIEVTYFKCPLIQYPASAKLQGKQVAPSSEMWEKITSFLEDKKAYVQQYGGILTK